VSLAPFFTKFVDNSDNNFADNLPKFGIRHTPAGALRILVNYQQNFQFKGPTPLSLHRRGQIHPKSVQRVAYAGRKTSKSASE